MDKALVDGVWTVRRSEAEGGNVPCDSEPAADALMVALSTPGRYHFTMECTVGSESDSRVVDVAEVA